MGKGWSEPCLPWKSQNLKEGGWKEERGFSVLISQNRTTTCIYKHYKHPINQGPRCASFTAQEVFPAILTRGSHFTRTRMAHIQHTYKRTHSSLYTHNIQVHIHSLWYCTCSYYDGQYFGIAIETSLYDLCSSKESMFLVFG